MSSLPAAGMPAVDQRPAARTAADSALGARAGPPITVLIVVPSLDGGAADAGAVELARVLCAAGNRAIVASRAGRRVADVTARVKRLAGEGQQGDDAGLVALAYDAEGRSGDGAWSVSLEEFTAVTGFHFTPMATISLLVNGEKRRTSATRVGPIDAALKAIRTAVSQSIRLDEFRLDAVTGGADSLCQVTVRLSDPVPVPVSALGRAVGPDIVTTSVDAAIEALNRLLRAQAQMPRKPGA